MSLGPVHERPKSEITGVYLSYLYNIIVAGLEAGLPVNFNESKTSQYTVKSYR